MKIVFEDNHLLAVDKPSGILTQPTPTCSESVENELKAFIKKRDEKKGNVFLHAVHRLDKEASGIVLFAKSQKALSRLSQAVREKKISKEYCALVEGEKPKKGTVVDFLFHDHHKALIIPYDFKGAKRAELEIIESEKSNGLWFVKIRLITGRYHQIRAQLSHLGNPIVGDAKYGSTKPFQGIALHHMRSTFIHPIRQEECEVYSLPSWFSRGM